MKYRVGSNFILYSYFIILYKSIEKGTKRTNELQLAKQRNEWMKLYIKFKKNKR